MPRSRRPRPTGARRAGGDDGLLALVALVLCGCATSLPPTGEGSVAYSARVVRVVAAEDFWGSIAAQIGG